MAVLGMNRTAAAEPPAERTVAFTGEPRVLRIDSGLTGFPRDTPFEPIVVSSPG
jgi:hypothetical protein